MAMCVIAVVGTARFRRLVRDYERFAEMLVGLHFIAFAMSLAHRFVAFTVQGA
ncbi:MAG TPA: hypothetical protein VLY63_06585 [Anaerolineae bacterium]|nr:hypothetical protein [Anaerolineae bacterium]